MLKKIVFALIAAFSLSFAMAVVNINTATPAELQTLKGIGAKKAADIVAYREQNGPFKTVEDLTKVKGIGAKTLEKLKPEITVDAKAQTAAKQQAAKPVTPTQPQPAVKK